MSDNDPNVIRREFRVLICGDRNWNGRSIIDTLLLGLRQWVWITLGADYRLVLIEGVERGADLIAEDAARKYRIDYRPFPANWNIHKKAAGPIRNRQMLDEGKPHLVIALHNKLSESRGTKDMVSYAYKKGVKVYHIREFSGTL